MSFTEKERAFIKALRDQRLIDNSYKHRYDDVDVSYGGRAHLKNINPNKLTTEDILNMGVHAANAIINGNPKMRNMTNNAVKKFYGRGFWNDFNKGFMSVIKPAAKVAKVVAPLAGPEGMALSAGLHAVGLGKKKRGGKKVKDYANDFMEMDLSELADNVGSEAMEMLKKGRKMTGLGKKKRKVSEKTKKRGALISKLMREEGMTLGEASRYIKENNLI